MYSSDVRSDHFIFVGGDQPKPDPLQMVEDFWTLFTNPNAPPQWAFGWHQSRWGYNSTQSLRDVVQGYADEQLPLDGIWGDSDYMDNYKPFTVGQGSYKDLGDFVKELHDSDLHFMPIMKSWIAVRPNSGYEPYDAVAGTDMVLKASKFMKEDFVGKTFSGDAITMDLFNDEAVKKYTSFMTNFFNELVAFDGVWYGA